MRYDSAFLVNFLAHPDCLVGGGSSSEGYSPSEGGREEGEDGEELGMVITGGRMKSLGRGLAVTRTFRLTTVQALNIVHTFGL